MAGTIIAGAIGNCVHVAGIVNFLNLAEELGYNAHFLGMAVSIEDFVKAIREYDPDIVGVSFRLTPEVAERILTEFRAVLEMEGLTARRFVFGGTPPVCRIAEKLGWFERCFNGLENPQDVWAYLAGREVKTCDRSIGDSLVERLWKKKPYPLLRHHFGLPDLNKTIEGVREIAGARVLDVISIAPDQNAQESFFRPEEMDSMLDGAGGVPIRMPDDLKRIYEASRAGNYPLLRIYSGTRDLIRWAELAAETINNAWGAIPLCWYSVLDGRSTRTPSDAIRENQETMRWYAERGISVEVNESHHWSMRDSHDTLAIVMAYLSAYNAKKMGVGNYISQYMFNSPTTTHGAMDLAKMLAKIDMVESLHDENFISIRQVRAGLLHLSPKGSIAKGQLAASTMLAMQLNPDIIHVVGYCEGDHEATPEDVIESCEIVHGVLRNTLVGAPDMKTDPIVEKRKAELLQEVQVLLDAIRNLGKGSSDPLSDPAVLAEAIHIGVLDAPQLKGNPYASGRLRTRVIDGAVYPFDRFKERIISESERLKGIVETAACRV